METFAGTSLPSGWSTFGGTNGSSTPDNSIPGWFRCDTVHQSGFSEDTISFCSGAISHNQWTELRMPLHTFHPGEQIKCNFRISSEDGHDSLLIKLFYDDGTEAAVYNIASGMASSIPYVYFPAAMDSAIVVGASTDLDYRSDYSQYDVAGTGKTVDFLAPSGGGFFGTTTTDRTGTAGYDATDYTNSFSGTSSSCPAASGLAALILSKNPHLSRNKVLEVMRSTCDEIGGVTYIGGVHKEYGHGRLNTLRAIENLPPVITGQNPLVMNSNSSLTISTNDLVIFDAETPYGPFTLTLRGGTNYTISGTQITPATGFSGTLRVPASINDGRYESDLCTLTVNVRSSNSAPIITSQHPVTMLEDHRYRITSSDLVISDIDDPSGPFLITATSGDNYTIIRDSIVPSPDFNGTLTVPVTASDGLAASAVFNVTITVTPVNDPPSFAAIGNQSILEDAGPQTVLSWANPISAGPNETDPITFNVTTSNPGLFRNLPSLSSSGTLSYTPAQDANGAADVRVRIFDGTDSGTTASISITITAVNDAPSFNKGSDISIEERSTPYSVLNWATGISTGPADEFTQTPTFNVSAANATLFYVLPTITRSGTLSFTPSAGQTGTSTITITLSDDGGTENGGSNISAAQQFTITIIPINTPPSFTKGPDINVPEDTGSISISDWATDINPGATRESGQILDFRISNDNTALFTIQPQISNNGTLSFTTAPDRFGTARIITRLYDNGGGNDSSAADTFFITVRSVNDPPSFRAGIQQQILEDAGAQNVPLWANDISSGPLENDSLYFKCTT
ncbi:MAG TPA: tandem-95 repeat protein, partial [Chitinispirillaceae bacterium]|nr:tandem-95 repeat protein [Chitinispirillaceae bacterium]